ncbi:MAG: hypothetical protein J6K32_12170, partial [Clostridia bacterium]|nr:hypothetical protein [Clostridia bacterium]
MRRRIAAGMLLLALLLFPAGAWLMTGRSFELMMERERSRALSEEAAIARAVSLEIAGAQGDALYACAQGLQARYGSPELTVMLIRHGAAMAGRSLPDVPGLGALLTRPARATLLDGGTQTLCIAHPLGEGLTLLLVSDVSPVYALRGRLTAYAALLCCAGAGAAALLAAA